MNRCIILIGVKHSGKTTTGQLFASQLDIPFFDIDHIIERQSGKTCRELYASEGVEAFQKAETEACIFFVEASNNLVANQAGIKGVVAAGGGMCDNIKALEVLKRVGVFVYLDVPNHVAFERILATSKKSNSVPATFLQADPTSENEMRKIFYEQYDKRSAAYKSIADVVIQTENHSPKEIASEIMKKSITKA